MMRTVSLFVVATCVALFPTILTGCTGSSESGQRMAEARTSDTPDSDSTESPVYAQPANEWDVTAPQEHSEGSPPSLFEAAAEIQAPNGVGHAPDEPQVPQPQGPPVIPLGLISHEPGEGAQPGSPDLLSPEPSVDPEQDTAPSTRTQEDIEGNTPEPATWVLLALTAGAAAALRRRRKT